MRSRLRARIAQFLTHTILFTIRVSFKPCCLYVYHLSRWYPRQTYLLNPVYGSRRTLNYLKYKLTNINFLILIWAKFYILRTAPNFLNLTVIRIIESCNQSFDNSLLIYYEFRTFETMNRIENNIWQFLICIWSRIFEKSFEEYRRF